jgi:hypothetical protein
MTGEWYKAQLRWAEMADRDGLRSWQEGTYLLRAADAEAAFARALAIGRRGEVGHDEDGQYVGLRFAGVVTLDRLGAELPDEIEVAWVRQLPSARLPVGYEFAPEGSMPPASF